MPRYDKVGKTSTEAVQKATGKSWDEWIKIVDKEGGANMTHKEIARMLHDKKYIESGWWCQQVTVGYEYVKGRRKVGETLSQGVEIGVSKTVPVSQTKLWEFVNSDEGKRIWLQDAEVEIRTQKAPERLRMRYRQKNWKNTSTLQIYVENLGKEKSRLTFHNEKLSILKQRSEMKDHWQKVLEEIFLKAS